MPFVPENILKKRRTAEEFKAKRDDDVANRAPKASKDKSEMIKRAETYVAEYKALENDTIRLRRVSKGSGSRHAPEESKLAFVVRIRGINNVSPKVKKILQLLRLRQLYNGVFIKLNGATQRMLDLVNPYIAHGVPNLKTVKELIYKRGFGKVNKQRVAISDNSVVEGALGSSGMICVEDLIHEIATLGPHFKEANNFLFPMQLTSPKGGFTGKLLQFNEGGEAGDRGEKINDLVKKML